MCKKTGMYSLVEIPRLNHKDNVLYHLKQKTCFFSKIKKTALIYAFLITYMNKKFIYNYVNSLDTRHYNYMQLDLLVNHHQSTAQRMKLYLLCVLFFPLVLLIYIKGQSGTFNSSYNKYFNKQINVTCVHLFY